jgi:hypothetical protein
MGTILTLRFKFNTIHRDEKDDSMIDEGLPHVHDAPVNILQWKPEKGSVKAKAQLWSSKVREALNEIAV